MANSFLVFGIKTYKEIINKQRLKIFNLKILKRSNYNELISENEKLKFDLLFAQNFPKKAVEILRHLPISRSQLRQDLFVLSQLNFKKKGFFVEFGAADGLTLSNTYILEKNFKWKGIVSEPAKIFHKRLTHNRNCIIEKKLFGKHLTKIFNLKKHLSQIYLQLVNFLIQTTGQKEGAKSIDSIV